MSIFRGHISSFKDQNTMSDSVVFYNLTAREATEVMGEEVAKRDKFGHRKVSYSTSYFKGGDQRAVFYTVVSHAAVDPKAVEALASAGWGY